MVRALADPCPGTTAGQLSLTTTSRSVRVGLSRRSLPAGAPSTAAPAPTGCAATTAELAEPPWWRRTASGLPSEAVPA